MQTTPAKSCTAVLAKTKLLGPGKWKRLFAAAMFMTISLVLGVSTCSAADRPVIFNYSKIAGPGDVVNLQGHAFGDKPEVWCSINNTKAAKLQVVNLGNNVVHAKLPVSAGHYQLQVKNANLASDFIDINQSRPMYAESQEASQGANQDTSQDSSWVNG